MPIHSERIATLICFVFLSYVLVFSQIHAIDDLYCLFFYYFLTKRGDYVLFS